MLFVTVRDSHEPVLRNAIAHVRELRRTEADKLPVRNSVLCGAQQGTVSKNGHIQKFFYGLAYSKVLLLLRQGLFTWISRLAPRVP